MRALWIVLLVGIGFCAHAIEGAVQMKQRFGPAEAFSVMVPADWVLDVGENFSVNAPHGGPSLAGTAYRIERRPLLSEFSNARYQGIDQMGIYKQVGPEHALADDGGVIREYEGIWPGDGFTTTYVVACKHKEAIYACLSLVTTKADFSANHAFYKKMLSTLTIHPNGFTP